MASERLKKLKKILETTQLEGELRDEFELSRFLKRMQEMHAMMASLKLPDFSGIIDKLELLDKRLQILSNQKIDLSSVKFNDYTPQFEKLNKLLLAIVGRLENPTTSPKQLQDLKEELQQEMNRIKQFGGAAMPRAWVEDSTADGTLEGTANGVRTTFVCRYTPRNNALFVFRGATPQLVPGGDYTLSQRTITFALAPITGEQIVAKYES